MKAQPRILTVFAVCLFAAVAAHAGVTVTVSSPANNAGVPTSFNVVASATTDNPGAHVTGWYVYVDSVSNWHTPTGQSTTTINANVSMSAGSHTVLVRAWDSTGAFGSQTLTLTGSACSGVCVTVTSPTATGPVASPVRFTASAVSGTGHSITGFIVYSDSTKVYRNWDATLDSWVILPLGTHNIYIRAWDSTGAFGTSATFPVNTQGTVIPTPLAGALTISNVDQDTTPPSSSRGWGSCGQASCAGGASDATSWPFTQGVSSPSRDGSSIQFQIFGPAYSDALWWNKLGSQDTKTNFLWDFWFYVPDSSTTAQAIEFDLWQSTSISGTMKKFMFGSQCNYAKSRWEGWNETTPAWVPVVSVDNPNGIACSKFAANTWHHAVYFVQRIGDSRDTLLYGNLTIDGVTQQWNLQEPSNTTTWAADTGVQYQLDIGSSGTDLEMWVDNITVTMW